MSRRRSSGTPLAAASPPPPAPAAMPQAVSARKRKPAAVADESKAATATAAASTPAPAAAPAASARRHHARKSAVALPSSDSDVEMMDAFPKLPQEQPALPPAAASLPPPPPAAASKRARKSRASASASADSYAEDERKDSGQPEEDAAVAPAASSSGAAAAVAADDDDEDAAEPADDYRCELLSPALQATPEVESSTDPFGSAERRATALLRTLSPSYLPAVMPGLDAAARSVTDLLSRTMDLGQNNAALLLGPRGCGKSALLELCIARLRRTWAAQGRALVIVRLSGVVQSDDTLALREIVSQLALEHELEQLKSSADFHTLLAFLHDILAQGAYDAGSSTAILFILDDFHHFVSRGKQTLLYNLCDLLQSSRARMCLIGVTQHLDSYERMEKRIRSRMSHRRILVGPEAEEMEREAQRAMEEAIAFGLGEEAGDEEKEVSANLPPPRAPGALQRETMDNLLAMLRARLELGLPEVTPSSPQPSAPQTAAPKAPEEEKKLPGSKRKSGSAVAAAAASSSSSASASAAASPHVAVAVAASPYARAHNAAIDRLLSPTASPALHARLSMLLALGRSPSFFLGAFRLAVSSALGERHPHLTQKDVLWAIQYQDRDWTVQELAGCTVLELTLLVSVLQLCRRHLTRLNFALAFDEYQRFYVRSSAGVASSLPCFAQGVAAKAWEELLAGGCLLVWADGSPHNPSAGAAQGDALYAGRAIQRQFEPVRLRVTEQELLEALKGGAVTAPTWLVQWAVKGLAE